MYIDMLFSFQSEADSFSSPSLVVDSGSLFLRFSLSPSLHPLSLTPLIKMLTVFYPHSLQNNLFFSFFCIAYFTQSGIEHLLRSKCDFSELDQSG